MSTLVLLSFFVLLVFIMYGKPEVQFFALFGCLVLFNDSLLLYQNPEITPYQLGVGVFFLMEIAKRYRNLKELWAEFPIKIPLLIVFCAIMTISYYHGHFGHSTYEALRFFIDKYAGIVIGFLCIRNSDQDRVSKLFLPIITIFCLFGIIEFLLNYNYLRATIFNAFPIIKGTGFGAEGITQGFGTSSWRYRLSITTKHPTALGNLLTVSFLFFLPYLKENIIPKYKLILLLCLLFVVIYLSGSRTALVCLLLFFTWYFINPLKLSFKIIFFVSIILVGQQFVNSLVDDLFQKGQGSSLSLRQDQFLFSVAAIANEPFFGNGFYYTQQIALATDNNGKLLYEDKNEVGGLESILFRVLIDQGLVGLTAFFVLFIWIFFYFFTQRNKIPIHATQGYLITGASFLFLLLSGEIGKNTEMCFMLIGLCLGLCAQKKELSHEIT